jgi:hypothetical protein
MRILILIALTACGAVASPSARFDGEDLVIQDRGRSIRLSDVIEPHAFHKTIHAIQRRGHDLYVVYGTSELSRGWPPKGGYCGCGLESYIRWLRIRDGKIAEEKEGRYESCYMNRNGWRIDWRDGKLIWSTEGLEREGDNSSGKLMSVAFTWSYDPTHPEAGISETKSPTEWQPEPPKTEQGGTGQPATRPASKTEDSDKPQPEAEGRSR